MSPEEAGLLQAIRDNLDEDGVRLIYADWLEEHGDSPRAEFIRLQCQLDRLADDDPQRDELEQRERELREHEDKWLGPLNGLREKGAFFEHYYRDYYQRRGVYPGVAANRLRRGFLEYLDIRPPLFLAHAEEIFTAAPLLHRVFFRDPAEHGRALAASPWLARLTAVRFYPTLLPEDARALAESPHWRRLLKLDVSGCGQHLAFGAAWLETFAAAPALGTLEELNAAGCGLRLAGVEALVQSPYLKGLTKLHLGGNPQIADAGAAALASAPNLARLTWLGLGLLEYPAQFAQGNQITDEGAASLAHSPHLTGLSSLGLCGNRISDDGAIALAGSRLANLKDLDLRENGVGEPGLAALIASDSLRQLEALGLTNNPCGPREEHFFDWMGYAGASHCHDPELAGRIAQRFRQPIRIY
jgi:uncharacterized protein (TIGR02996 family)